MAQPGPIPVFPQGPNEQARYEYSEWPQWMVSPEGKRAIFNNPEEVPDGWMTHAEFAARDAEETPGDDDGEGEGEGEGGGDDKQPVEPSGAEQPRELTADQRKAAINKLVDGNTQADLVGMLELMNEGRDDEIEFSSSWPKTKLAAAIVANGGPLEETE